MDKKKKGELNNTDVKNKTFSLFLLFFPTVIIAGIPCGFGVLGIVIKILLALYQFVSLNQFIERMYQ